MRLQIACDDRHRDARRAVAAFQRVAWLELRKDLQINSCIASSHVAVKCFARFNINAYAVSVNWLVSLDNERKFFSGSRVQTKLLERGESVKDVSTQNQGYDGHVVTVVSDRYIVDASFDQAISNLNLHFDLGMELEPKVLIIGPASEDLPRNFLHSSPEILASGKPLCVSYEARPDTSFQSTPAWNAPVLDTLSREIWRQMVGEFANMGLQG